MANSGFLKHWTDFPRRCPEMSFILSFYFVFFQRFAIGSQGGRGPGESGASIKPDLLGSRSLKHGCSLGAIDWIHGSWSWYFDIHMIYVYITHMAFCDIVFLLFPWVPRQNYSSEPSQSSSFAGPLCSWSRQLLTHLWSRQYRPIGTWSSLLTIINHYQPF